MHIVNLGCETELTSSTESPTVESKKQYINLIPSSATRWNGDYKMAVRALQFRYGINEFVDRHANDDGGMKRFEKNRMFSDDWQTITDLSTVLESFYKYTMEMQGKRENGALYDVIPNMEALLNHLEDCKKIYKTSLPHLATTINLGWMKIDKYYTLLDKTPVLYAAVVLDPRVKWTFFESNWEHKPDWISSAKKKVRKLWEKDYRSLDISLPETNTSSGSEPLWKRLKRDNKVVNNSIKDEYDRYCSLEPDETVGNIKLWWLAKKDTFPRLSRMALEILAIPAMSAECERVFSR